MVKRYFFYILILILGSSLMAQENPHYQIEDLPIPEGIVLEVGGLAFMPDGALAACTRRGEVWIIKDPYATSADPANFSRFASGLHEPLGLAYKDGSLLTVQRGELTKLTDKNGDGKADSYESIAKWPLSGNYHDYGYGPLLLPNGNMMVALNLSWIGYGASLVKWRGWMLEITPEGEIMPYATGMRSPAGFGLDADGELFYSDNQGDWVGSGRVSHVSKGDFVGNPQGLKWAQEEGSPVSLTFDMFADSMGTLYTQAMQVDGIKEPTAWFPHGVMGISTSAILLDDTKGKFGPFENQMFIGDQGQSKIMRMQLEKVDGSYQAALFPFTEGFSSGVLRQVWGEDGTMFVGMTNRGWASTGRAPFGIQRLKYNGKTPFEMHRIEARPDGFEIFFTQKINPATVRNMDKFSIKSFTYHYHSTYGSPAINIETCNVSEAILGDEGGSVYLKVDNLREGYVHEIRLKDVKNQLGKKLLHDFAYYTLNKIPGGGTGQQTSTTASNKSSSSTKRVTTMPVNWNGKVDESVEIATKPGMYFNKEVLEVKAGSKVKLTFNNDDDMQHNWVLVKKGTIDEVGLAAIELGIEGPAKNYVPDTENVIYHTKLLEPETTEDIYFIAPDKPGEYPFVCTMAGHHITMRGILKVK
ncbi:MAG: plastocyanin/azurin family copper-binding protein [Bacteroidota bacterium]